jgi:NitT/TauT family transport system permease protein
MCARPAKVLAVVAVLVIWQPVYLGGAKPSFVFPGPAEEATNLWQQLREALLWQAIWTTMGRALLGFGPALLISTAIRALISRNTLLRRAFGPVITLGTEK